MVKSDLDDYMENLVFIVGTEADAVLDRADSSFGHCAVVWYLNASE